MAVEVEIKLKIDDPAKLIEKLETLGFTSGKTILESDTYFTSEHHDFVKLGGSITGSAGSESENRNCDGSDHL